MQGNQRIIEWTMPKGIGSSLFFGPDEGGDDGAGEDQDNDSERDVGIDAPRGVAEEHFDSDEGEDKAEAELEVVELVEDTSQGEVEGAEAEDGEDIGGVDDEGVPCDSEDGGDGVDGEDEVGEFDDEKGDEEGCGHEGTLMANKEVAVVVVPGDRDEATEEADNKGLLRVDIGFLFGDHLDAREDEKGTEDVDDPGKFGDEFGTDSDHGGAHDEGTEDAPEEDFVLVARWDGEVGEEQGDDEDVIDAEGFLDDVAGEEFEGFVIAHEVPDAEIEGEGEGDPDEGPGDGLFDGDDVAFAIKDAKVERQHDEDKDVEADPGPVVCRHE